jgi:hypothetical protein
MCGLLKQTILQAQTTMKTKTKLILLIPLLLACLALLPKAHAVNPPPDGGYPGANTAVGTQSLFSLTSGVWNTALGYQALNHDTVGGNNTATGVRALLSNTIGNYNTANGVLALSSNISGVGNVATGYIALRSNGNGGYNTANGYQALSGNMAGSYNVALGAWALAYNTVSYNTAIGVQALYFNTAGNYNTAIGYQALYGVNGNSSGFGNTATGNRALYSNTEGFQNTANGVDALHSNTAGQNNTAIGQGALGSNTTGIVNTALGVSAGSGVTTADNVICIGAGVGGENVSNTCYIGNIFGVTSAGATAVYVNSLGKLGTVVSSLRFKDEIKPMDHASEAILALKPVTFRYKEEIDPARSPQFGLVAEDVEKVNPDLVVRDGEGKVNTVRYEAVNAMLLNEFLKEHHQVQDLKAIVAEQQKQIEALTAGLQKVCAQVETSKTAPQVVNNP